MTALWVAVMFVTTAGFLFGRFGARRLPFAVWSPVYVVPGCYVILSCIGYFYYRFGTSYLGGFYDLGVSDEELAQSLAAFLAATGFFLIGAFAYVVVSKRVRRLNATKDGSTPSSGTQQSRATWPRFRGGGLRLLAVLLFPLVLIVIGKGPDSILWRTKYLVESYHYIHVLGSLLALPAIFVLGLITLRSRSVVWRLVCVGLFLTYEILYLSLSTRQIAAIFLFYIAGLALGGARRRTVAALLVTWVISLPLLLQVPLELRGMPQQGVIPLLGNLASVMNASNNAYVEEVGIVASNLTFGVPLASYVGAQSPIPKAVLATSVSPLPSFVSVPGLPTWDKVREHLRVSLYIPYSTLGELLNYGWLYLALYYLVAGTVAAWLDVGVRYFTQRWSRWGYLFGCGAFFLFAITSTQYNLRSATRIIWYALIIAALWRTLCRLRLRTKHRYYTAATTSVGTRAGHGRT